MLEPNNVIPGKRGVYFRDEVCGVDHGFEDEVIDRVSIAMGFFRLVIDLLAQCHERAGVHLNVQIEVRDGGLG